MAINIILEELNNEYHFNSGGCCYVAYLIARELERIKEPFKLVIQASSYRGNHYCLTCPRFGFINPFDRYDNQVVFTASSETIKRIYDENEWSTKYDTRNNKAIEEEIRHIFSIY